MKCLGRLARVCVLGNRPSALLRPLVGSTATTLQRSHPPTVSVSTRSLAEDAVCSSLSSAQAEPPSHIRAIRAAKETVPPPEQVERLALWCKKSMETVTALGQVVQLKANFVRVRLKQVDGLKDLEGQETTELPHRELLCVVRAMLKKMERRVYVGDTVHLSKIDWIDGRGVVEDIVPRETLLEEPAIANVNHILLVFAADRPEFSPEQASRFLVTAESSGIPITVVLNKADLVSADKLGELKQEINMWGYQLVAVSARSGLGVGDLLESLAGKVSVVAGPSGVGKSSLINSLRLMGQGATVEEISRFTPSDDQCEDEGISPDDIDLDRLTAGLSAAEVEEVLGMSLSTFKSMMRGVPLPSKKLETSIELERTGRVGAVTGLGTHTTRHVSLIQLSEDAYLADTPGFNKPTLDQVTTDILDTCFPEVQKILSEETCRFPACTHVHEPGCAVRNSDWSRYAIYKALRSELVDREAVDKARSSSKKSRQGKVKMKSAKGGNARVEARLEAKKYRRPARRTGSETYVEEDEDGNSL